MLNAQTTLDRRSDHMQAGIGAIGYQTQPFTPNLVLSVATAVNDRVDRPGNGIARRGC